MISELEKTEYLKIFGSKYSSYIQNSFEEDGIKNEDNSPVSKSSIRMTMNGLMDHERFEVGIANAAVKKKAELRTYESKKSKILGIKKAGTAIPACK